MRIRRPGQGSSPCFPALPRRHKNKHTMEELYLLNTWLQVATISAGIFAIAGCLYSIWKGAKDYPTNYDEDLHEYTESRNKLMDGKRDGIL